MTTNDPAKKSYSVFSFVQDETTRVYTNWSGTVPSATSILGLAVTTPPNTGTLDDKHLTIDFPLGADSSGWLDSLVAGHAVAPVSLVLTEYQIGIGPGATQDETINLGRWRLVRGRRNPEGQRGLGRLEFLTRKGTLNVPLGIPATPRCAWTLGDKTCGVVVPTEAGRIQVVDRQRIKLTNPADVFVVTPNGVGKDARYWLRGSITVAGLTIGIRDWSGLSEGGNDIYAFELVQAPPPTWLGQVATLRPGCDKTAATCAARWDNLEFFGGFGIAIPSYHPVLETP